MNMSKSASVIRMGLEREDVQEEMDVRAGFASGFVANVPHGQVRETCDPAFHEIESAASAGTEMSGGRPVYT